MGRTARAIWIGLTIGLLAGSMSPSALADGSQNIDSATLCRRLADQAEGRYRIPRQLLGAIALAESGRWDAASAANTAWPWTVYAEGRGRYFATKRAAVAELKKLRSKGVRNIDAGCMQINLYYHSDAFESLEAALDPARNVDFAARWLQRLHRETRAWSQAIAYYHSRTLALNRPYRVRVLKLWDAERRRVALERRRRDRRAAAARQAPWRPLK